MYRIRAHYLPVENAFLNYDHYFSVHVPLAVRQMNGAVKVHKVDIEKGAECLFETHELQPLLVLSIYVESTADVEDFKRFVQSDKATPLLEDVPRYTNCRIVWTASELAEN